MSRDNFGEQVSLLAAAALVVDYTLTVAVSIAAGTASLTSAFPRGVPLFKPPRVRRAKRTELLPRRDPGRDAAGPGGAGQPLATNNHFPHL